MSKSIVFSLSVLLAASIVSAQSANVVVSNIPRAATAINLVVDGPGIESTSGVLPGAQQATNGNTTASVSLTLPIGGPYRIRVIATGTSSIQRSGQATGIQMLQGNTLTVPITLGDISSSIDPSTPVAGEPGRQLGIKINVLDPGDWIEDSQGDLNFTGSVTAFSQNAQGIPNGGGAVSKLGIGRYQLSFTPRIPISGNRYYFQVYTENFRWRETTFARLYIPDLSVGASLYHIEITGGNIPPYAVELSPFQGAGVTQTFTGTFNDANGWTDIAKATFFFHESYAGTAGTCTVEIRPQAGQITLLNDAGVSYLTPVALGSTTPLQNSACSVDATYSGFSGSGNVLTANVALTFKPAFGSAGGREPRKAICQWAEDTAGAGEDQSCFGMWLPETPAPVKIPRYRLYNPANYAHFFTASQNERDVLVTRGFTPEDPPPGMAYNQPATISGISTHPFYRILFFPQNGAPIFHYWTRDREEYKAAVRNRTLNLGEGMDSFLLSGQAPGTYPTYRMRFTAGPTAYPIYHYALQAEHDALLGFGWGVSMGVDGYLQPMPAPLTQVTAGLQTPPRKVIAAVLSAASHEGGPVAPGQLIRVYGSNFSKFARAFVDDSAVQLTTVTERYIELAIPETVAGKESIALFVDDLGVRTEAVTVPVTPANPAVFVKDFLGRGIVETLPSDPGTITLQVTGAGELDLGQPKFPLSVRLNGYPAEIISISTIVDQPGRLAVNVKLPAEVLASDTDLATVALQAGEANAQPGLLARVK